MTDTIRSEVLAERCVLGSILIQPDVLSAISDKITPAHFLLFQHQRIFAAMLNLHRDNKTIDTVTLMDTLASELDSAGGAAYLSSLPDGLQGPRAPFVLQYIEIIRKHATLRDIARDMEAARESATAAGADPLAIIERVKKSLAEIETTQDAAAMKTFHAQGDYMEAPQLRFAIENFVQLDAATIFGGLAGQGKTWLLLSIAKALLDKPPLLWDHFPLNESAEKVIYLIPESTIGPFAHRLRRFGLMKHVENGRLLTRTLSKGPRVELDDPRILAAANGAHVFLDTIGRWSEGDENSAGDNQRGLAADCFGLLGAGARSVIAAHHSPKGFSKETVMNLENCLRGSGDVGAMVGTAFGIRQIDPAQNIIHIECVKPRDFEPPGPFQLIGRPYIDDEGDFRMYRKPGECGSLSEYLDIPGRNKAGATVHEREARAAKISMMRTMRQEKPGITDEEMQRRFHDAKIEVARSTIRKYRLELDK